MVLKNRLTFLILSLALLIGFGGGIYRLLQLQMRFGETYPSSSTFSAEPKGAKLLYLSMKEMYQLEVERKITPLDESEGAGQMLFYLGAHDLDEVTGFWSPFLESGGRLVYAIKSKKASTGKKQALSEEGADDFVLETESEETNSELLSVRLEYFFKSELKELEQEDHAQLTDDVKSIAWRSAAWFDQVDEEIWTVCCRYLGKPVIIERAVGEGSLVLVADSYLFSNEALMENRPTELLIDLIGSYRRIAFEELHFGIRSKEGVMMLITRYRLHGVVFAFLVLAGLFVWQRAVHLLPLEDSNELEQGIVAAEGSLTGFAHLLERHISKKKVMGALVKEWRDTFGKMPNRSRQLNQIEEHQKQLNDRKSVVVHYNELMEILKKRK